jgi:hypothetical protein
MEETITDEEICQQLLELAQTPEQIRYLTGSNQTVLMNKVIEYKEEMERDNRIALELRNINQAKEDAYLKVILTLAKGIDSYYD